MMKFEYRLTLGLMDMTLPYFLFQYRAKYSPLNSLEKNEKKSGKILNKFWNLEWINLSTFRILVSETDCQSSCLVPPNPLRTSFWKLTWVKVTWVIYWFQVLQWSLVDWLKSVARNLKISWKLLELKKLTITFVLILLIVNPSYLYF